MTKFYAILLGTILLTGCSRATPPPAVPLTEAHQKFLKICREELKLEVVVQPQPHTVWIYVPLQEELINLAATAEGTQKSESFEERPAIKYLESSYENKRFVLTYDIRNDRTYAQSPGYKMDYTPRYQEVSRQVMTAILQSYVDAQETPFFVIIIADIRRGLEIQNIFYLEDLKRYMAFENIPQEEFIKRSVYEVNGRTDWIGDSAGRHLAYTEITMPEFLAKQMATRINFKYQKSSFPPSADTRGEILNIVAETLQNYQFTDFNYIELHDLAAGLVENVLPAELNRLSGDPGIRN